MMALESESIKIVQNVKVEIINPWMASSIFEFQFFCCPECDEKSQDKQDFVNHATNHTGVSFKSGALLGFSIYRFLTFVFARNNRIYEIHWLFS